ncbi:MAG TPA: hypothetical protein VKD65_10465 [Candidatus Angelobacter sp.]|nr:hypothetical protein [Candidatus Angelobacter sp.]
MEAVMDKDLRDDMLKLVRYKILYVRREYEVTFPEQEDIVPDNMDGDAFTAWKVAEFIQDLARGDTPVPTKWADKNYPQGFTSQNGKYLTGIPHEDKKYLRVYYEVLERYPREKFKYEEQQIRVLEEIRDRVAAQGDVSGLLPDPFAEMMNRLQLSSNLIITSRQNLAKCADKMSEDLADILNKYRNIGHFVAPEVSAQEIADALTNPPPFDRATLDRFTGTTIGDLRVITPGDTGPFGSIQAPPSYSIWGKQVEASGPGPYVSYRQKITGSNYHHIDPYDNMAVWNALSQTQVDLTYNAWTKDLGFVTWSSYRENHDNQLLSWGYEMKGKILWFNMMFNPDFTQTIGPLPIQPPLIVTKDQLIVSIDFILNEGGKTYFCVYALHINFNFQKCSAEFADRVLKLKSELITKP